MTQPATPPPRPLGRPRFSTAWSQQDSYGWVLVLLALDMALLLLLPAQAWAGAVQVTAVGITLLLALRTSGAAARTQHIALAAVLIAVAAGVGLVAFDASSRTGGSYYLIAALLLVTPFPILRRILSHRQVTARTLAGALSVYLMIGLFFAFTFLGIATSSGGDFFVQTNSAKPPDFVYFSYVTELTIGYGDLTAAGNLGRFLAVMDGMLGQIFLVTTVARLVSLFGRASIAESGSHPTDDTDA